MKLNWTRTRQAIGFSLCMLLLAACATGGGGVTLDPCGKQPAGGISQLYDQSIDYEAVGHEKVWQAVRSALDQLGYRTIADAASGKITTDPKEIPCPVAGGSKQVNVTRWYATVMVTVFDSHVTVAVSFDKKRAVVLKKSGLAFPDKENEIRRDVFERIDRILEKPPIDVALQKDRGSVVSELNYAAKKPLLQISSPVYTPESVKRLGWLTQEITLTLLDPDPGKRFDVVAAFTIVFQDVEIPMQRTFKDQPQGRSLLSVRLRIPKDIAVGNCTIKTHVSAGRESGNVKGSFLVTK